MKRLRALAGSERRRLILLCAVLAVVTAGRFLAAASGGLHRLDDPIYVTENTRVQDGITWDNVRWAFTTTYFGFYYPITWLSHMLDCQIYGLWAGGHHLTSLLIHIANALLLFIFLLRPREPLAELLRRGLLRVAPAACGVGGVDCRAEGRAQLTFLHARAHGVRVVLRATGDGQVSDGGGSFCSGLMAKPMIVTAPLLMLLLDYWPLGRWRAGQPWGKEDGVWEGLRPRSFTFLILEKVPLLVMSTLAGLATVVTRANLVQWSAPRLCPSSCACKMRWFHTRPIS